MVQPRQPRHVAQRADPAQDLQRRERVPAHLGPLLVVERSPLVEDPVRHAQLADVVQQPGPVEVAPGPLVEPEQHGQPDGDARHALGVPRRVGRLGVDHGRERLRHPVEPRPGRASRRGRSGSHAPTRGCSSEAQNNVVVLERAEHVGEHRVEPRAAPRAGHLAGSVGAAQLPEHVGRLRQAEDAAQQRDLLAGDAGRIAAPVPVLVERGDRLRGRVVHAHVARHVGPALAAQRGQLARAVRAVLDQRLDVARLGERRRRRARCCAAGGAATAPGAGGRSSCDRA